MRFFILFFMSVALFGNAAEDAAKKLGYLNSYAQAIERAKQENKTVMLLVVQDGCHWCKKFERVTLSNKEVQKLIEPFVKVVVDRYDEMPQKFQSRFFPMVYFVDPATEEILAQSFGYRTKALFLEDMKPLQKTKDK